MAECRRPQLRRPYVAARGERLFNLKVTSRCSDSLADIRIAYIFLPTGETLTLCAFGFSQFYFAKNEWVIKHCQCHLDE